MKVGDLVRYNAAGQREKSMALVMAFETDYEKTRRIKLMWIVTPGVFPGVSYNPGLRWDRRHKEPTWYKNGDWIEVIDEGR